MKVIFSASTQGGTGWKKHLTHQRLENIEVYRHIENGGEIKRFDKRDMLHLESVDFTTPMTKIYADTMRGPCREQEHSPAPAVL